MTVAARLTGVGTFFAYDYDETDVSKFRVGSAGTAFSFEFDENTATTLTGVKMMSAISNGGLIVRDSLNEVDPFSTFNPITGGISLQLYTDAGSPGGYEIVEPVGQTVYNIPGTYVFTVPNYAPSISAVVVGGGGGGGGSGADGEGMQGGAGGALCYGTITVTSGESLTVVVGSGGNGGASGGNQGQNGGNSSISRGATALLTANGGQGGDERTTAAVPQSTFSINASVTSSGGGNGGGCNAMDNGSGSGGGGAGGYSGAGGQGGGTTAATAGQGGGGGGGGRTTTGQGYGGGGVGIFGSGAGNGTAGVLDSSAGGGGSAGNNGTRPNGGIYGGGGGAYDSNTNGAGGNGASGAVRIIWGKESGITTRAYPSTFVADLPVIIGGVKLIELTGNIFVQNHDLLPRNGTTYSSANGGYVLFDGVDDYLTTGDSLGYLGATGTAARTSIIWFRIDTPNIAYRLYGWGTTATGGKWNLSLDVTTFKARAEIGGASVTAGPTAPSVIDGKWHMVAVTAPANGTANDIRLYIDGALVTDTIITNGATVINTSTSGLPLTVGASLADVSPGYMSGAVSSFLIYDQELTELQIKENYRLILNRY